MLENNKITEQTLTGTTFTNWLKLLYENRFKISLRYFPRALFISVITLLTSPFVLYEKLRYAKRIRRTVFKQQPIFIVGHWRSGTTFLHSLMIQDKQFGYVTNVHAFMPNIFLCSGKLFQGLLRRFLPAKRRMDNIRLGLHEPQEDEYALANLTNYSLYHGIAFPKNIRFYARYCSMEGLPRKIVKKWTRVFLNFLKKVTYEAGGKQLILKNPAHTYRIGLLLKLFPEAKFIHIYRNPFDVFPSTLRMYEKMFPYFFLQKPFSMKEGKEIIFDLYEEMFQRFFMEKQLIPKGNLIEIKYETFIQNPLQGLEQIYSGLNLQGFEKVKDHFQHYVAAQKNYQRNVHTLDKELEQEIATRWKFTLERLGYKKLKRLDNRIERKNIRKHLRGRKEPCEE
ncbi:MAG: sulfotransferase family protein [Candidatus Heimdallarchaeota archaeon]|nr:MAG: sulfotransferase [Candidatus Gerdarchaeota archaeon]